MKVLVPTTVRFDPEADVPAGHTYVPYDPTQPVPAEHEDAEVLVVWGTSDDVLADAARRLRGLRLVQLLSAGSDNAVRAGFAPDVAIASGRGLHDRPVAEHALALVLAAARRLDLALDAQRRREWAHDLGGIQEEPSPGRFSTLRGARVLIWGYGSIGSTLAPHLTALGAEVVGAGRNARQQGDVRVVDQAAMTDELARTDVVVMILPSTDATRHSLDGDKLAALPDHAWVVNVGRGDTIDQAALIAALHAGTIGGAALDVTDPEPLPSDDPLWDAPNLILTPHAAGGRPLGGLDLLARNLDAVSSGREPENLIKR